MQDADPNELNAWAPKILDKVRGLSQVRDVTSDQQNAGTTATLKIDRDAAARFGIQPQQLTTRCTMHSDSVRWCSISLSSIPTGWFWACRGIARAISAHCATFTCGAQRQCRAAIRLVHTSTDPITPLAVNHQSQFPAVTISFNMAPGQSLGAAVSAITAINQQIGVPPSLQGSFQGNAAAFQSSLSSEPYLIAAALVAVYIILGILYESYILPLTILSTLPSAGVGALLMLMISGRDLSVIAIIGIILLIGIVKKNGIMMVDFAIHAERNEGAEPLDAIRQACLLRFRPDHDDHGGRITVRAPVDAGHRRWLRTAPAFGLRHGRWSHPQPGADALHHAGDLSLPRPAATRLCAEAAAAPRLAPPGTVRLAYRSAGRFAVPGSVPLVACSTARFSKRRCSTAINMATVIRCETQKSRASTK